MSKDSKSAQGVYLSFKDISQEIQERILRLGEESHAPDYTQGALEALRGLQEELTNQAHYRDGELG